MKIPSFHPNIRQRQGGFVITMEALLIGVPVMFGLITYSAHVVTEQGYLAKAQNGGGKSNLVNKATNTYMSTAYLVLTDSTPDAEVQKMIAAGNLPDWVKNVKRIGDPNGPDYNLCPDHMCIRITTADLRQAGLPIWRWIKIWPHDRLVPDPTEPEPAVSREIITYRFWAAARRARLLRLTYAHVLHRYGEEKKLFVRGQLVDLDVSTCHIYVYYGEDREIQASFGPAHFGQYDCPHIWIHRRKVIDLFDLLIVRGKRKQLASR